MIVTNTTSADLNRIKELLRFAARGIKDTGIEVHVKNCATGWQGRAWTEIPVVANVAATSKHLIVLRVSKNGWFPEKTWSTSKRVQAMWPEGIPFDSWEDVFVFIAAHEFYHIKLGRKSKGQSEVKPTLFALKRLNEWRVQTNRPAIPSV